MTLSGFPSSSNDYLRMKNLYVTLALSATVTLGASAAHFPSLPMSTKGSIQKIQAERGDKPISLREMKKAAAKHAPTHRIKPNRVASSTEIIEEVAEGTHTDMSRATSGYLPFWGQVYAFQDEGLAVDMVETDTNTVYFSNPLAGFPVHAYLKGTREGDLITIESENPIYAEPEFDDDYEPTGNMLYAYVMAMEFIYDDPETPENGGWYYATDGLKYQLRVTENGIESTDPDMMLGLVMWDAETESWQWLGYGDYDMLLTKELGVPNTLPEGATYERWSMINADGSGAFVNVSEYDNALYVQGLYSAMPDAWAKMTLDGTTATLSKQYLGKDDNWHYAYAMGCVYELVWDDYYEEETEMIVPQDSVTFTYDRDGKSLTANGSLLIAPVADPTVMTTATFDELTIKHQTHKPGTPPAAPHSLYVREYDPAYGYGSFDFSVPMMDTDGVLLDRACLSYRIYLNGEVMEFYNDEYTTLPDEVTTEFPCDFNDNYDFYTVGISHTVTIYFEGYDSLGVQSIYYEPETNAVLVSEISSVGEAAVKGIQPDRTPKSTVYFNLQGMRVSNPSHGLYIRHTVYTDGTVENVKTIVK